MNPEDAKKTPNRTIIIDEVLSTGFNADNIDSVLNPADAGRILTDRVPFAKVLIRTPEQQASLSIADIDEAIAELQMARDVLSGVSAAVD